MASQSYYIEISNDCLGKHKRMTGRTPREVQAKSTEQLLRWYQEEERKTNAARTPLLIEARGFQIPSAPCGPIHPEDANFAKLAFHEGRLCRAALPNTRI